MEINYTPAELEWLKARKASLETGMQKAEPHCGKCPPAMDGSDCKYCGNEFCPYGKMKNELWKLENKPVFAKEKARKGVKQQEQEEVSDV